MSISRARQQAARYGWSIDDDGRLVRPDGVTIRSVVMTTHRGKRLQVRAVADNSLIWSGGDIGSFLASFHCAMRINHATN